MTAPDGAWRVAVTDAGVGMPAAQLPYLFEPFNRLGRADLGEGVGVGLALSRRLVQKMGGELTVSSTAGHGSTFAVRSPAATAAPAP